MKNAIILFLILSICAGGIISCELWIGSHEPITIIPIIISLDYRIVPTPTLRGTIRDAKEIEHAVRTLAQRANMEITDTIWMLQEGTDLIQNSLDNPLYPTGDVIRSQLLTHVQQLQEHQILFIYYSGHGYGGAFSGDLVVAHSEEEQQSERLPVLDIMGILNQVRHGDIIFVLDSCHSGAYVADYPFSSSQRVENNTLVPYNPRVTVVSASSSVESSWEGESLGTSGPSHIHGRFSYLFLEALGWNHGDGYGEVYNDHMVLTQIDGYIDPMSSIPAMRNGVITIGNVFAYITSRIEKSLRIQHPMTILGPLDKVFIRSFY